MFYGNNIQDTRQFYFTSWQKYQQKKPLTPLEKQIVNVMIDHPEYHSLFEASERRDDLAYFPEMGQTNPFLHMGLHLAVRDQVATDKPSGITSIYHRLLKQYGDANTVDHLIMENFAECLWQAQRSQNAPDEMSYLNALRRYLGPTDRC